jgi:hypothetical protein
LSKQYHQKEHVMQKLTMMAFNQFIEIKISKACNTHDSDMQRKTKYNCNDNITIIVMLWQVEMKMYGEIEINMPSWYWAKCLVNCKKCKCCKFDQWLFSLHHNCSQVFFSISPIFIAIDNRPKIKEKKNMWTKKKNKSTNKCKNKG